MRSIIVILPARKTCCEENLEQNFIYYVDRGIIYIYIFCRNVNVISRSNRIFLRNQFFRNKLKLRIDRFRVLKKKKNFFFIVYFIQVEPDVISRRLIV